MHVGTVYRASGVPQQIRWLGLGGSTLMLIRQRVIFPVLLSSSLLNRLLDLSKEEARETDKHTEKAISEDLG